MDIPTNYGSNSSKHKLQDRQRTSIWHFNHAICWAWHYWVFILMNFVGASEEATWAALVEERTDKSSRRGPFEFDDVTKCSKEGLWLQPVAPMRLHTISKDIMYKKGRAFQIFFHAKGKSSDMFQLPTLSKWKVFIRPWRIHTLTMGRCKWWCKWWCNRCSDAILAW